MTGYLSSDMSVLPIDPIDRPLEAVVRPPGSKSITNRALVVAALATGGVSRIEDPLDATDTSVMRRALRSFGVMIDDVDDPWLVLGTGGRLKTPAGIVDVGASGTTARFITALAALVGGTTRIDGTERMRERPIGELTDALEVLGVHVETAGGFPPVTVTGGRLSGGLVAVDASRSSQFVSALLMVAPLAEAALTVEARSLVSAPYVETTVEVMRAFGGQVETIEPGRWRVAPGGYRPSHVEIEADASAAVYPLVAAAVLGGVVTIEGIPTASTQADLAALDVLAAMGCEVHREESRIHLAGPSRALRGVDVDMNPAPDAVLGLAIACLFAQEPSRLRNVGTLRLKETDRLEALVTEIRRVGGDARVEGDDLVVVPGDIRPARVHTYDDHRMAMAFSLIGLARPGIEILDPGCVEKTWPGYFDMLAAL